MLEAMQRFPEYGPQELATLEALAAPILDSFRKAGYARAEPSILQPADVFLDLYGEAVRKRIYVFAGPQGEELCLRPDLTVPLARMCLRKAPGRTAAKFSYFGPAFRSVPEGDGKAAQFLQAGIERLGGREPSAEADAEVFALVHGAVQETAAGRTTLHLGDPGLFAAFADALDLPEAWRGRLKRRFRSPAATHDLLARAAGPGEGMRNMDALLSALSHLSEEEARAALRDVLTIARIDAVGGRSMEEITERFLEQAAAMRAAGLPDDLTGLIRRFLSLSVPAPRAVEAAAGLAQEAGLDLDDALEALAERLELIGKRNIDLDAAEFATAFGRDMDYYTGFVFEFRAPGLGENRKIAGGGRYDALLARLGAEAPVPAVGGSVWVERLAAISHEKAAPSAPARGNAP
ncbi:MAG: ATP phosphoribosyltransferase regulatory subunit [Alphaproteobacteria bacterium]